MHLLASTTDLLYLIYCSLNYFFSSSVLWLATVEPEETEGLIWSCPKTCRSGTGFIVYCSLWISCGCKCECDWLAVWVETSGTGTEALLANNQHHSHITSWLYSSNLNICHSIFFFFLAAHSDLMFPSFTDSETDELCWNPQSLLQAKGTMFLDSKMNFWPQLRTDIRTPDKNWQALLDKKPGSWECLF